MSDQSPESDDSVRTVHGIDRVTDKYLCGEPSGLGTDAIQPAFAITCPLCVLVMEHMRTPPGEATDD